MTRKQARRKKQKKTARIQMPKIRIKHIFAPLLALAAVVATYYASASMLDRPIRSIEINGPFQRVTALQIEEAISADLEDGFVSADLLDIQQQIIRPGNGCSTLAEPAAYFRNRTGARCDLGRARSAQRARRVVCHKCQAHPGRIAPPQWS
jgi:hypothetical protein